MFIGTRTSRIFIAVDDIDGTGASQRDIVTCYHS